MEAARGRPYIKNSLDYFGMFENVLVRFEKVLVLFEHVLVLVEHVLVLFDAVTYSQTTKYNFEILVN